MAGDNPFDTIVARAKEGFFALLNEFADCRPNQQGRARCPIHKGDDPSAFLARKNGTWSCFSGCGEEGHGDAVEFLVRLRGGPANDAEARTAVMYDLAPRYGIELKPRRKEHGGAHAKAYQITKMTSKPTKEPDPHKSNRPAPDTSTMNGGEPLDACPVRDRSALAVFPYRRATGEVIAYKVRKPHPERGKTFSWHHADGRASGRDDPLPDEYRGLVYRLPELRKAADDGETLVVIGEGEKVVDALRSVGLTATSHHGGASATWGDEHAQHVVRFQRVALFPDNDLVGRSHMERCAATLATSCPEIVVRTVSIGNEWCGKGIGDVADFIAVARSKKWTDDRICSTLREQIDKAFEPPKPANAASLAIGEAEPSATGDDADEASPVVSRVPRFPSSALYGPLGDWVRVWEPHTEASPIALYMSALSALGAVIGRGPFFSVNGSPHHGRLFVLLVGPSGRARKGVTIGIMQTLLSLVDPVFSRERVQSGLSTSEGLISHLRDATAERIGSNGKPIPATPGVEDKRLLVVEEEFANVLGQMRRNGNDIGVTLRSVWDGITLRRMTKGDPMQATAPHVAIIGAITPDELRRQLTGGDVFNGFGNRLLPVYAAADRLIAEAGQPAPVELLDVVDRVRSAVQWAHAQRRELLLSRGGRHEWNRLYPRIARSTARSELLRALHERGAPYVRRLALLLALLDRSLVVDVQHLRAAFALWEYAAATWEQVFPDVERDGLVGRLEAALRAAGEPGLSRTEIRKAAKSNNIEKEKITAALTELADAGVIVLVPTESTSGKRREVWRHVHCSPVFPTSESDGSMGDLGVLGDLGESSPSLFGNSVTHSHASHISHAPISQGESGVDSMEDESHASQYSQISHVPTLHERDAQLDREWLDDDTGAAA